MRYYYLNFTVHYSETEEMRSKLALIIGVLAKFLLIYSYLRYLVKSGLDYMTPWNYSTITVPSLSGPILETNLRMNDTSKPIQ